MAAAGLNPRSLLFTLYGDYARPLGQEEVRVGALVQLADELGVSDNALRSALSRMSREGWLAVSDALPERRRGQRDRMRVGLSFLGFGSLGNGIFVSPHDLRREVRELIGRQEVEQDVTVHYGTLEWPADPAQVVARAWDLARLEEPYRAFLLRIREGFAEAEALDDR